MRHPCGKKERECGIRTSSPSMQTLKLVIEKIDVNLTTACWLQPFVPCQQHCVQHRLKKEKVALE